jgi:3-methyladenine DNA glycosylase AlkD
MIQEILLPLVPEKFVTDEKFRAWHLNVLNVLPAMKVMGLRVGDMRRVARDLARREDALMRISQFAQVYSKDRSLLCYEEVMIWGMMINAVKCSNEEKVRLLRDIVAAIDNWAVCDSMVSNLKNFFKSPEEVYGFIKEMACDTREYHIRFALVSMLCYYIDSEHIDEVLHITCSINDERYYVKMAQAWLISVALVKRYDKTVKILEDNILSPWVHNKSIQKARESFRLDDEKKSYLTSLKRKA